MERKKVRGTVNVIQNLQVRVGWWVSRALFLLLGIFVVGYYQRSKVRANSRGGGHLRIC